MFMFAPWDNSFAKLTNKMFARINPEVAPKPQLLAFNAGLAEDLGIAEQNEDTLARVFSGAEVPEGAEPIAQAYAGHQFGNFVPSLGDGRAVLLGEVIDNKGQRRDIQLKGSGRTPFSRGGDGKAWLGPILREYVVSEAMYHLSIPTTRALAATQTGDTVIRDEGYMPGAVVTRVASSHIRVGTFQYFAARGDREAVEALFDYSVARHYPGCSTPLEFLNAVIARQADLIAKWMGVGFIHGVMNTDNTTISGETIDYGPCAFMDRFHPATVYSSIDRYGRYAYGNQPDIVAWNLAQLASSLLILEADEDAAIEVFTQTIHKMPELIGQKRTEVFGRKLGIANATQTDRPLINQFLEILTDTNSDFTNSFRLLSDESPLKNLNHSEADKWVNTWQARLKSEHDPVAVMNTANPVYIPRNHQIEAMIQAALKDDLDPLNRLNLVFSNPYVAQDGQEDLTLPPTPDEEIEATFCGT